MSFNVKFVADSWPQVFDDSCARKDWEWNHKYDLAAMTTAMMKALAPKYFKNWPTLKKTLKM